MYPEISEMSLKERINLLNNLHESHERDSDSGIFVDWQVDRLNTELCVSILNQILK